jgi:hypothetical protein
MRPKHVLFAILIGFVSFSVTAENLRGPVRAIRTVTTDPVSVSTGVNDIAVFGLGEPTRFVKALRLEVRIPPDAREFSGGLALYLYQDLSPSPEERVMTLRGTRVFFEGLPNARRFFVVIPTRRDHGISSSADTFVVEPTVAPDAFPVAFAILPAMKGLPEAVETARFSIEARQVLFNEGALRLDIVDSAGNAVEVSEGTRRQFRVRLNGETLQYDTREVVLTPGLHEVELVSDIYENRNVTVGVERGTVTSVVLELVRPQSRLRIEAPQGSEVFLDGTRLEDPRGEVTVEPGQHTVLFRVGDYTVSRSITVEPKRDYNISLSLDILVNEE